MGKYNIITIFKQYIYNNQESRLTNKILVTVQDIIGYYTECAARNIFLKTATKCEQS